MGTNRKEKKSNERDEPNQTNRIGKRNPNPNPNPQSHDSDPEGEEEREGQRPTLAAADTAVAQDEQARCRFAGARKDSAAASQARPPSTLMNDHFDFDELSSLISLLKFEPTG